MSSLVAKFNTFPLSFSPSFSNQAGTGLLLFSSTANFIVPLSFLISLTLITSPAFTKYYGISTFLPFTSKAPCVTCILACALELANPNLYTTLSNLLSSI